MEIIKKVETKNGRLVVLLDHKGICGPEYLIGVANVGDQITKETLNGTLAGKRHYAKEYWALEDVIKEKFEPIIEQAAAGYIFG